MKSVKELWQTKTLFALLILALLIITNNGLCLGIFDAGVHFTGSSPQGEFKDITDQNGYGVSATALFKMGLLPLKLGLEIGTYGFGEESSELPAGTVEVESETKNFTGHLVLRLQQGVGDFAPYADALLGINVISTDTTIKGAGVTGSYPTDYKDTTFSYGIGAGLMYKLTRIIPIAGPAIYLDIKARYLLGGDAEFQKKVNIVGNLPEIEKDKFNSNQLMYHLGIMIGF